MSTSLKNKGRLIPASKAVSIRKKISNLNVQTENSYKSVSESKKEFDKMVDVLKNDLDSMSEMGEMESLRLQMAMDRMSKMMSTLSNLLKKISDTASSITQNLK